MNDYTRHIDEATDLELRQFALAQAVGWYAADPAFGSEGAENFLVVNSAASFYQFLLRGELRADDWDWSGIVD